MVHRYFAVRVSSDRGSNIYRLIGLANETDKLHTPSSGDWPDYLILTTQNESDWVPIVELSVSPMSGRYLVNCSLTVEQ